MIMKKQLILFLCLITSFTAFCQSSVTTQQISPHFDTLNIVTTFKPYIPPVAPPTPPVPTPTPGVRTYTTSSPINWSNKSNTSITGLSIDAGNTSTSPIVLNNCHDIVISYCRVQNSKSPGIQLLNGCYNITVVYNYGTNVSTGVYVENSSGGNIQVNWNQFLNVIGPLPRGQFVQFNTVTGPGLSISHNYGENIAGKSNPEDAINVYMSGGTATSPLMIRGNKIRGGGPSTSGGGIMTGDQNPLNRGFIVADSNILVNPGQYGMSIAGGNNISIINNQVYATKNTFTNVGIYVWPQQTDAKGNPTPSCSLATVAGNLVNWTNSKGQLNGSWDSSTTAGAPNCGVITGWNTNNWNAQLNPTTMLPATLITYN